MPAAIAIFIVVIILLIQANRNKILKNIEYDPNGHRLKVIKRDENNRAILSYKSVPILQNQYNPATATYTGVTVGGITTGGWNVNDAHYSTKAVGMSDRYHLWCKTGSDKNDNEIIDRIDLTPEDAEIARNNSVIAPLLHENSLILKHLSSQNSVSSSVAKTVYNQSGNMNLFENAMAKDLANQNLTLNEVKAVIDFLCASEKGKNFFKSPAFGGIMLVIIVCEIIFFIYLYIKW